MPGPDGRLAPVGGRTGGEPARDGGRAMGVRPSAPGRARHRHPARIGGRLRSRCWAANRPWVSWGCGPTTRCFRSRRTSSTSWRRWPARRARAWSACGWRREMETERLRNTLLSSVSHDLRTPLAAITGAASALLQPTPLEPAVERGLKEAIYDEADRLSRLVTNLLDMTRLESGSLRLSTDWQSLEELVGSALARLDRSRKGRAVEVSIPADLPLVPVDAAADGAGAREPPGQRVQVHGAGLAHPHRRRALRGRTVTVEVADEGPGLPLGRGGPRVREVLSRDVRTDGLRPGSADLPGDRGRSRRPDLGGEPQPAWRRLPLHPAARRGAAAGHRRRQ